MTERTRAEARAARVGRGILPKVREGQVKCPVRGCKAPADVLYEGRWTCIEHFMGHDPRDLPMPPELLNAEEVDGANYTAERKRPCGSPS